MESYRVETNRLILRPFSIQDAEEYFRMTRDKEIQTFVPYACPASYAECLDDISNIYSKGDFAYDYYVLIEEKSSHTIIGAIICVLVHDFDTSFFIRKEYRHHGYMQEALKAFIANMKKGGALQFDVSNENKFSLQTLASIKGIEEIQYAGGSDESDVHHFILVL